MTDARAFAVVPCFDEVDRLVAVDHVSVITPVDLDDECDGDEGLGKGSRVLMLSGDHFVSTLEPDAFIHRLNGRGVERAVVS